MRGIGLGVVVCGMLVVGAWGQAASPLAPLSNEQEIAKTRAQATATRDAFVKATLDAGFKCPIAPPTIVVEDVPSFGNYEPETNKVWTSSWVQLSEAERALFFHLVGPGATEATARAEFETGAHHWVFVHELGHWWQACRQLAADTPHYAVEFGADRMAAAYWAERDPALIAHMEGVFRGLMDHAPNPVPEGQDPVAYFNANYEQLGPTPSYIWFQARMCVTAFAEKPTPSFARVLKETGTN